MKRSADGAMYGPAATRNVQVPPRPPAARAPYATRRRGPRVDASPSARIICMSSHTLLPFRVRARFIARSAFVALAVGGAVSSSVVGVLGVGSVFGFLF